MHILIIPSWYSDQPKGVRGSFFRDQALSLQKNKNKVGILVPPKLFSLLKWKEFSSVKWGIKTTVESGIPVYRNNIILWIPQFLSFFVWRTKRQALKSFRKYIADYGFPDIMHVHSVLYAGVIAEVINKKYNIPYVVTEHSTAYARELLEGKKTKQTILSVLDTASLCLAVSKSFVNLLNRYCEGKILWQYLPNMLGHEFEFMDFVLPSNTSESFYFYNISILSSKKRIDLLLRAFADAFKGEKAVLLRIGGDGKHRVKLEKLARELDINEQVCFLGMLNRQNVINLIKDSHVCIVSSDVETFGVVVIESLSLGRPVISTECGGPESIIDSGDGYVIPKGSIKDMSLAIRKIYSEYDKFDFFEIRRRCLARFSSESIAIKLNDYYQNIINKVD